MERTSKYFVVILAISIFITLSTASAQVIPKPSIPDFTIETIDSSYDVAPTTSPSTNPYTGEVTTTINPGYRVENKTTFLKITNQPFTPYNIQQDGESWTVNLFYNVEIKGNYTDKWSDYKFNNGSSDRNLVQDYSSEFTLVQVNDFLPEEGKVDFRVQALEGYQHGVSVYPGVPGQVWIITGSASDWSSTQTLTMPASYASPSPTSTVPEFPYLIVIPLLLSVLAVALAFRIKKPKENTP